MNIVDEFWLTSNQGQIKNEMVQAAVNQPGLNCSDEQNKSPADFETRSPKFSDNQFSKTNPNSPSESIDLSDVSGPVPEAFPPANPDQSAEFPINRSSYYCHPASHSFCYADYSSICPTDNFNHHELSHFTGDNYYTYDFMSSYHQGLQRSGNQLHYYPYMKANFQMGSPTQSSHGGSVSINPSFYTSTVPFYMTQSSASGTAHPVGNFMLDYQSDSSTKDTLSLLSPENDSNPNSPDTEFDKKKSSKILKRLGPRNKPLNEQAVQIMEKWYEEHIDHPYPNCEVKDELARVGHITLAQVNSWFANRRNRSDNTRPKKNKKQLHMHLYRFSQDLEIATNGVLQAYEIANKLKLIIDEYMS